MAANQAQTRCPPRHSAKGIATMHANKKAHSIVCCALIIARASGLTVVDG
jgi:hypothetical protein